MAGMGTGPLGTVLCGGEGEWCLATALHALRWGSLARLSCATRPKESSAVSAWSYDAFIAMGDKSRERPRAGIAFERVVGSGDEGGVVAE